MAVSLLGFAAPAQAAPISAIEQSSEAPDLGAEWEADFRAALEATGSSNEAQDRVVEDARNNAASYLALSTQKPGATTGMSTLAVVPNGCTLSPDNFYDISFKAACDTHDICYGSSTDRLDCDKQFLLNLISACIGGYGAGFQRDSCTAAAGTYYGGVRSAGWAFYSGSGANN
jgi:hypothetical protein